MEKVTGKEEQTRWNLSDAARERKRLYEKEYYQRNNDKILQQRKRLAIRKRRKDKNIQPTLLGKESRGDANGK